ncbi:MAG: capsular polysaccharide synthesis protein, partial [Bacteroidota bacterium]
PYFWFFYLFEKLYHQNKVFQTIWDQTPKFSADIPHKIQHFGIFAPLDEAIKKDIDQAVDPLYKLTFKFDQEKLKAGSTLHYLLSKAPSAVDQN